jgi:hypothetical protein
MTCSRAKSGVNLPAMRMASHGPAPVGVDKSGCPAYLLARASTRIASPPPRKSRNAMFIALKIKAKSVYHGYDEDGKLIIEPVGSTGFVEKVIRIDRILSFTEDYIFIECPHDTAQTWEYEGTLADIKAKLASISALV